MSRKWEVSYLRDGEIITIQSHTQSQAMRSAKLLMYSYAGRVGEYEWITVTGDGEIVWKWQFGKGVTYPSAAELAQHVGVSDDNI